MYKRQVSDYPAEDRLVVRVTWTPDSKEVFFQVQNREQTWLDGQVPTQRPHLLLPLWCIKEALFKANPENAGKTLADHEIAQPGESSGDARTRDGRLMQYACWSKSRTCIALAVCR